MIRNFAFTVSGAIASLLIALPVAAAPVLGPALRINDSILGDQSAPSIARTVDGGFIVAWEGDVQGGGVEDIFVRRFNAAGAPLGPSVRVNTFTPNRQALPIVAANASGQFVVVWDSNGQDSTGINVYFRRFAADGTPLSPEIRANNGNMDAQLRAGVAIDDAGNVVVVWPEREAVTPLATSLRRSSINFRQYDANNVPRAAQAVVMQSIPTILRIPAVALVANGSFVVTWQVSPSRVLPIDGILSSPDGGVFARRYNAAGAAQGAAFEVDTAPGPDTLADRQSIASAPDGRFVVAYERVADDYRSQGIFARRYDAAGNAIGAEFGVTSAVSQLRYPSVAMDAEGNFTIVAHGDGVFAQRFANSGVLVGDLQRVDVSPPGFAQTAAIVTGSGGQSTVVWQDFNGAGDGDGRGIAARALIYP